METGLTVQTDIEEDTPDLPSMKAVDDINDEAHLRADTRGLATTAIHTVAAEVATLAASGFITKMYLSAVVGLTTIKWISRSLEVVTKT